MRQFVVGLSVTLLACGESAPAMDFATSDFAVSADLAQVDLQPARRGFPLLDKNGGAVLNPMTLVTIVAQNDALAAQLATYSDHLAVSAWWKAAAQPFGLGAIASAHATGPAITSDMTQAQMIAYVQNVIAAGAPAPNGNTCYLLYLPDNVHISGPLPFGAYHTPFPSQASSIGDGFAVVSRAPPYGGGETQLQELMRTASHEILEAATDPTWQSWSLPPAPAKPWMGSPWQVYQLPGPIESADLCEGSRLVEASGDEYQRYFSNEAAAAGGDPCVPPTTETYFNVYSDKDWYSITSGQTISVSITGWSVASAPDWYTIALIDEDTGGFVPLDGTRVPIASPLGQELAPCSGEGMNDSIIANVSITAPATVKSGDYAVIEVESFRTDPQTCYPYASGDQFHSWVFGVYVP